MQVREIVWVSCLGSLSLKHFWFVAGLIAILTPISEAQVTLIGRVTDENDAPVAGARISLSSEHRAGAATAEL